MFVHADVGDFRICVSAPRHREGTGFLATKKQGILNHDAGGKIGGMGELPGQASIAGSVNVRIGGLEAIVHQEAFARIILHARSLQIEPFDVRRAASPGQNLIHYEPFLFSVRFIAENFPAAPAAVTSQAVPAPRTTRL